jgi:uncharacterized membrane protein YagU involved in acid resistance
MRKTKFTKLFSVIALIACLVSAVLFTEFVSAGQFREPSGEDLEVQDRIEPVGTPDVSEPPVRVIEEIGEESRYSESFWFQTYSWDVAVAGVFFVASVVFGVLFGVVQKVFSL